MTDSPAPARAPGTLRWLSLGLGVVIAALLVPVALDAWADWRRAEERDAAVVEHLSRADAALEADQFGVAEMALDAARTLAPTDPRIQRRILRAGLLRAAALPQTVRDEELGALEYAAATLRGEGAPNAEYLVAESLVAGRRGDVDAARAALDRALAADPDCVHAWLAQASLHRRAGRRLEALAAYEKAVAVAPGDLTARNNLGVQYLDFDRAEDAVKTFEEAIAVRDNAASRLNLAEALTRLERTSEAADHLRRASALAPSSAEVYRRLGGLLAVGGKYDEAEQSLLRAFDLSKDPVTALNLGALYQAQERHDRAVKLFEAVLDAQPGSYEAAWRLALSRKALGDRRGLESALVRYLEAAERIPDEAERVAEARNALATLRQTRPALPPGVPGPPPGVVMPTPPATGAVAPGPPSPRDGDEGRGGDGGDD